MRRPKPGGTIRLWLACLLVGAGPGAGVGAETPETVVVHECGRLTAVPTIDGDLDEAAWKAAPETEIPYKFLAMGPTAAESRSTFRVGFDDQCLYLAGTFFRTSEEPLRLNHPGRDDPDNWMDDSTELYFDPEGGGWFYKLIVTAGGGVTDLRKTPAGLDYTWDATRAKIATRVTKAAWFVEMSLPWPELGLPGPPQGLMTFEILRFSGPTSQWSSWTVGASFGTPEKFGYLSFGAGALAALQELARTVRPTKGPRWQLFLSEAVVEYRTPRLVLEEAIQSAQAQRRSAELDIRLVPEPAQRAALTQKLGQATDRVLAEAAGCLARPDALTGPRLAGLLATLRQAEAQARELAYEARLAEVLSGADQ